jgi:hypothetical protein
MDVYKIRYKNHVLPQKFYLDNDDIKMKSQGGFISSILTGLIPLGIDLISRLFTKGNGITKNEPLEIELFNNRGDIKKMKTCGIGLSILNSPPLLKHLSKIHGKGIYGLGAGTMITENKCGGKIGNLKNINYG